MRRLYFCPKMFTFEGYSITQTMKRTLMIVAAVAALFATSCKKPVNPDLPTINWASNPGFAQQELAPGLDGAIAVSAPGKIDMLTITLGLGDYAILANPYIGVSSNKGSGSKTSPVFDVVDDSTVASFLQSLGMSAGSSLMGKTLTNLDLVKILETLIKGQPVANNTSFTMKIDLKDQAGNAKTATAKFHFTSAPSFVWDNNASFAIVDLNEAQTPAKIKLSAPGKVDKFTITLENGADSKLVDYIKNRTTGGKTVIDLIGDATVASSFKKYFPAGDAIAGKTEALLDFSFMYDLKYDMGASTNVFTLSVTDKNGKNTVTQVKFKK